MPRVEVPKTIRRIQEACDTCRGKKRKCPGERPGCSLCDRLGQECSYRGAPHGGRWPNSRRGHPHVTSNRHSAAVSQTERPQPLFVDQALLDDTLQTDNRQVNIISAIEQESPITTAGLEDLLSQIESICAPQEFVRLCADFFLEFMHNRPYPLLVGDGSHSRVIETLIAGSHVPSDLLSALLALTCGPVLRSLKDNLLETHQEGFVNNAWRTISASYSNTSPEQLPLSFLQALCLMVQADLANGNISRSQTQVSLGLRIAQIKGLTSSQYARPSSFVYEEEYKRCVWSLFMLDRVISAEFTTVSSMPHNRFRLSLPVPDVRIPNGPHPARMNLHNLNLRDDPDSGATPVLIRCFMVWGEVVDYVFQDDNDDVPPWAPESLYARVEALVLNYEVEFHPVHRYVAAGFPAKALNDPLSRPYFSTWLCFQILLHSTMCLLNHPYVLYQKLHRNAKVVPPTFLQKSYEASMIHSGWVMRLVREMNTAQLMIKDPFYGYLVSIAASIQLEHSRSKHLEKAAAARQNFDTALEYTRKLAAEWPMAEDRTQILLALAARFDQRQAISNELRSYNGAVDSRTADDFERLTINDEDTRLLRNLLAYARPPILFNNSPAQNVPPLDVDNIPINIAEAEHVFDISMLDDWSFFGEPWTTYMNFDALDTT